MGEAEEAFINVDRPLAFLKFTITVYAVIDLCPSYGTSICSAKVNLLHSVAY